VRRWLNAIAIFLPAGALVNVAVAWGCALYRPNANEQCAGANESPRWPVAVPENWPDRPSLETESCALGVTVRSALGFPPHDIARYKVLDIPPRRLYSASVEAFGLPARCLSADTRSTPAERTYGRSGWRHAMWVPADMFVLFGIQNGKRLPLRPIWAGFVGNTLLYAAIAWLLHLVGSGAVRRYIRTRRGLCPACAFPTGASGTCTECGRGAAAEPDG
jgi:hypothetical protein